MKTLNTLKKNVNNQFSKQTKQFETSFITVVHSTLHLFFHYIGVLGPYHLRRIVPFLGGFSFQLKSHLSLLHTKSIYRKYSSVSLERVSLDLGTYKDTLKYNSSGCRTSSWY